MARLLSWRPIERVHAGIDLFGPVRNCRSRVPWCQRRRAARRLRPTPPCYFAAWRSHLRRVRSHGVFVDLRAQPGAVKLLALADEVTD
jgi:hypothetical protein